MSFQKANDIASKLIEELKQKGIESPELFSIVFTNVHEAFNAGLEYGEQKGASKIISLIQSNFDC